MQATLFDKRVLKTQKKRKDPLKTYVLQIARLDKILAVFLFFARTLCCSNILLGYFVQLCSTLSVRRSILSLSPYVYECEFQKTHLRLWPFFVMPS